MINLVNPAVNSIVLYLNTTDLTQVYNVDLFLFGFKNGFTNKWTYVAPIIVEQNSRYTEFSIELTTENVEDPLTGSVALSPSGNWSYSFWSIETATLDPTGGILLDSGQMYLQNTVDEETTISYISDNDASDSIVYLSSTTVPVAQNINLIQYVDTTTHTNFLFGFKNGFTNEWSYFIPTIIEQNTRYTEFNIFDIFTPSGNWDYTLWSVPTATLDPTGGTILNQAQVFILENFDEVENITYVSDNEDSLSIVYLTRDESKCAVWSSFPDLWNLSALRFGDCI